MKELIYKKGLLLKIVSWENDGDHYQTKEVYVDTLEKGKALQRMFLKLFKSENNGEGGIGNSFDSCKHIIENYRESDLYFKNKYSEEEFYEFVSDFTDGYVGWSVEGYNYRICESCILYEIKEDVYLNKVEI